MKRLPQNGEGGIWLNRRPYCFMHVHCWCTKANSLLRVCVTTNTLAEACFVYRFMHAAKASAFFTNVQTVFAQKLALDMSKQPLHTVEMGALAHS